ncbi:type 1 fimbrial protein [Escherichia coli]
MKKTVLAVAMTLMVGSSASAIAATPASGTTIGTGTLAVTGTVGESACTVSFPASVTMPSFSKADFSAKAPNSVITTQSAGNITFSGCSGQSVNIKVATTSKTSGNGLQTFPSVGGKVQGQYALFLGLEKAGAKRYIKVNNLDDPNFQNIGVTNDNFTIPVSVDVYKIGTNANDISYGSYSVSYVFTATYA